jgi:hypothetical protein
MRCRVGRAIDQSHQFETAVAQHRRKMAVSRHPAKSDDGEADVR